MSNRIRQILDDLYKTDPGLRKYDAEFSELLANLLSVKPNATADDKFRRELRALLIDRASELESQSRQNSSPRFTRIINMPVIKYAVGAIAVVVITLVVTLGFSNPTNTPLSGQLFDTTASVKNVGSNAFGDLATTALTTAGAERTQSGGGDASAPVGLGGGFGGDGISTSPLIYPANVYKYVYTGQDFELPASPVSVLRRENGYNASGQIVSLLKQFNTGAINLDSFGSPRLQNFSLIEPGQFGYQISADLENGQISINQNWQTWPELQTVCAGPECPTNSTILRPEDIPAHENIVSIATEFLSSHGISTDGYGQPFVMEDNWRLAYDMAVDKNFAYIPDTFSVVFPVVIDGQVVHDESGTPTGLSVSVNVRYNRVVGLWSLTSKQYQASDYAAETNKDRILSIVESGGLYAWSPEQAEKIIEVELGTPELGLVRIWHGVDNRTPQELYVPSLIFPVTRAPENEPYFRKSVVVPLVKEILDSTANPGPIRILAE